MTMLQHSVIESGGYNIQRSLRFRSSASAYLSRTYGAPTNAGIYTFSFWTKIASLSTGRMFFCTPGGTYTGFSLNSSNQLNFFYSTGAFNHTDFIASPLLRDPSAWYHIVCSIDYTQSSGSQVKMYVNGVQQTVTISGTGTTITQTNTVINTNGRTISFGQNGSSGEYYDGYFADAYFIDGQALTPSSFGQTDAVTGVWTPKKYTGTYGTNGFYLPFSDNTSATTLAYDKSGNGNNWTANNISTTAGATYDSMTDVPTLTSATAANYAVINPLDQLGTTTTNGNLKTVLAGGGSNVGFGSFAMTSGKWYWEITMTQLQGAGGGIVGIADQSVSIANRIYYNVSGGWYYEGSGLKWNSSTTGTSYGASYTTGNVIAVAYDADAGSLTFYKDGVSQGVAFNTGLLGKIIVPAFGQNSGSSTQTYDANFGQRPFSYTPPTGFKALNTYNLPDPTIKKPNQYMDATTYTGNTTGQSIVNSGAFQPDFVWVKQRNSANSHVLIDAVRGNYQVLYSNLTSAESTATAGTGITAFNTNGFALGTEISTNGSTNAGSQTYVGWQWKKGATPGFDIVTYTGTGANRTVSHNLGVAPKMIIVKNRSGVYDWRVYVESIGAGNILLLNTTAASTASSTSWNSTAPTSSVFSIGTAAGVNNNGDNFVAYLFAEIPGFSKFGSYTGNSSADGSFVYCGFRPRYILIKASNAAWDWMIYDTAINPYNLSEYRLYANLSAAQAGPGGADVMDIVSNGFKLRGNSGEVNTTGNTYIYAAFAENPFKYSNAR